MCHDELSRTVAGVASGEVVLHVVWSPALQHPTASQPSSSAGIPKSAERSREAERGREREVERERERESVCVCVCVCAKLTGHW